MSTGLLLPAPVLVAVDSSGDPISGAQLQFYLTGTTTPASIYTDQTLETALPNPVVANGAGLFPAIFLDPTVVYRAQLLSATGALIADRDPVSINVMAASQTVVNAGTIANQYVSPATLAGWTGVETALGFTPLNKAGDTATGLLLAAPTGSPPNNSAGYLGTIRNEQDGNYTFLISDAGKMVRANAGSGIAYTIPANTSVDFWEGAIIMVRNVGAGTVTLTRGSGVTQTIAGSGTSKDVALAQWGLATLVQETINNWVVSGSNIS